jgi:ApaG protein
MITSITKDVRISVETEYQPGYSSPAQFHYVFTYKITIENLGESTIQLRRRHWYIHDAARDLREVEGEGVVGQQPILEPGQSHVYVSGCNLKSGIGKMYGSYQMERIIDGKPFEVRIPEFIMVAPFKQN